MAAPRFTKDHCVVVKRVTSDCTEKALLAHFSSKKNGGRGDVELVLFPSCEAEGTAIIVFWDTATPRSVLACSHVMKNNRLTVEAPDTPCIVMSQTFDKDRFEEDSVQWTHLTNRLKLHVARDDRKHIIVTGTKWQVLAAEVYIKHVPPASPAQPSGAKRIEGLITEVFDQIDCAGHLDTVATADIAFSDPVPVAVGQSNAAGSTDAGKTRAGVSDLDQRDNGLSAVVTDKDDESDREQELGEEERDRNWIWGGRTEGGKQATDEETFDEDNEGHTSSRYDRMLGGATAMTPQNAEGKKRAIKDLDPLVFAYMKKYTDVGKKAQRYIENRVAVLLEKDRVGYVDLSYKSPPVPEIFKSDFNREYSGVMKQTEYVTYNVWAQDDSEMKKAVSAIVSLGNRDELEVAFELHQSVLQVRGKPKDVKRFQAAYRDTAGVKVQGGERRPGSTTAPEPGSSRELHQDLAHSSKSNSSCDNAASRLATSADALKQGVAKTTDKETKQKTSIAPADDVCIEMDYTTCYMLCNLKPISDELASLKTSKKLRFNRLPDNTCMFVFTTSDKSARDVIQQVRSSIANILQNTLLAIVTFSELTLPLREQIRDVCTTMSNQYTLFTFQMLSQDEEKEKAYQFEVRTTRKLLLQFSTAAQQVAGSFNITITSGSKPTRVSEPDTRGATNYKPAAPCASAAQPFESQRLYVAGKKAHSDTLTCTLDNGLTLYIHEADITQMLVDVIVCPANANLEISVGAAKALAKAAGPYFIQACEQSVKKHGNLQPMEVRRTVAGKLPCKEVYHAFGPGKQSKPADQPRWVQTTLNNVLKVARERGVTSIAIPAIGAGTTHMPLETTATSILLPIVNYDKNHGPASPVREVHVIDIRSTVVTGLQEQLSDILKPGTTRQENAAATQQKNSTTTKPNKSAAAIQAVPIPTSPGNQQQLPEVKCTFCDNRGRDFKKLKECGHHVCRQCFYHLPPSRVCPACRQPGSPSPVRNVNVQPQGTVTIKKVDLTLPGFPSETRTLRMKFDFSVGHQMEGMPEPGRSYFPKSFYHYLPDNTEGTRLGAMFREAFDKGVLFRLDRHSGIVPEIQLKTEVGDKRGTPEERYPDPGYLRRVEGILRDKGIISPTPAAEHSESSL